jgi:uncharacterized membrane protein YeaQ/YmgE (transglycosylase-associated protein family)
MLFRIAKFPVALRRNARVCTPQPEGTQGNMSILAWIILGLIVGVLAKTIVPGEGPGGIVGDIVVGILGALVGGWLFNSFGHTGIVGFNLYSMLVALVGAVVLLIVLRLFSRRTV